MNSTLGNRIAILRRAKELKQDELAEKLGVSPQAVSKWENDQTCPDISLLPLLSKILGVSVDELLSGQKEEAPTVRLLPAGERKDIGDMMIRIVLTNMSGDMARVNLPLAIIKVMMESEMNLSQISGNQALKSIDLGKIMDMVRRGAIGNLVEVESADGDTVRIIVE